MLGAPPAHIGGLDRVGEGAARAGVGNEHALRRIRDRGGLGHEVHAAHDDHRRVALRRASRHPQRVGHHVGEILDLGTLIVVRDDERAALGLEGADFGGEGGDAATVG